MDRVIKYALTFPVFDGKRRECVIRVPRKDGEPVAWLAFERDPQENLCVWTICQPEETDMEHVLHLVYTGDYVPDDWQWIHSFVERDSNGFVTGITAHLFEE